MRVLFKADICPIGPGFTAICYLVHHALSVFVSYTFVQIGWLFLKYRINFPSKKIYHFYNFEKIPKSVCISTICQCFLIPENESLWGFISSTLVKSGADDTVYFLSLYITAVHVSLFIDDSYALGLSMEKGSERALSHSLHKTLITRITFRKHEARIHGGYLLTFYLYNFFEGRWNFLHLLLLANFCMSCQVIQNVL